MFHMSHREFLEEPTAAVRWMLEIGRLYDEARRERRPPGEQDGGDG